MEDKRIIELYFKRDEAAIKETAEKYGRLCHGIAFNILSDAGESEECENDTYFQLWNKIPPEEPRSLKAFIAKIARNLALKKLEYNSAKKRNTHATLSIHELEASLPDSSFAYDIEDEALGELINEFLRSIAEDSRNVFVRRYFFHDGIRDISARYAFSSPKVKSMLHSTRARLRKFLIERGVYL